MRRFVNNSLLPIAFLASILASVLVRSISNIASLSTSHSLRIVKITSSRFAMAIAKAIPVFPEVGSTKIVLPGLVPCSAALIMLTPIRSLTEEDGFMPPVSSQFALHNPQLGVDSAAPRVRPINSMSWAMALEF